MKKFHAVCERCGKPFNEGYVLGGEACICSEECLKEQYTEEQIEEMEIGEDNSESYYTEREDENDMFYDENGELIEEPDKETLRDLLLEYEIATEQELQLITDINGYSIETLNDVLYAREGYHDWEQYKEEIL